MKGIILILFSFFLVLSCVKDKKTTWETNLIIPIVKSELSVTDLLKLDESPNIIVDPDSLLKIVYSSDLFSINPDSFIKLPDSAFEVGSSLQSLNLPNGTFRDTITLGEIMRNSSNPFVNTIIYNMQDSLWPYPDVSLPISLSVPTFDILKNNLFDVIKVGEGYAKVKISNEMEFSLSDLEFKLSNSTETGGGVILEQTFSTVEKYSSASDSISLSGKTISSQLTGEISNLIASIILEKDVTLIDTNQYILAEIILKDIKPLEATAIWPNQNIIDETKIIYFGEEVGMEFKDATIRKGDLYFEIYSSLEDSIYITYEVSNLINPSTLLPFKMETVLPPAKSGEISSLSRDYPIDDYHFDFNGMGYKTRGDNSSALSDDTINSYVTHLSARIQYSGLKKTLSMDDTVYVKAQIRNLKPSFVRGYFNNQLLDIGPSKLHLDLFNKVKSGNIDLEDVNFEIEIDNGIGASAEVKLSRISGFNKSNKEDLTFTPGNELIPIGAASYNDENIRTIHTISSKKLTPLNSNIDKFIENFPNILEYELEVELNRGKTKPSISEILDGGNPPNFIHNEDGIKASFNMEVPLSLIADSLVLVDTLNFNLINQTRVDVESGKFKLLVDNGFPMDANTSLYFLDNTNLIIDSLWTKKTINRSVTDKNGRVTSKTRTVINFEITKEKMDIIKMASKVYIVASFHTFDLSNKEKEYYRIYSGYSFDIKLIGEFERQFSN